MVMIEAAGPAALVQRQLRNVPLNLFVCLHTSPQFSKHLLSPVLSNAEMNRTGLLSLRTPIVNPRSLLLDIVILRVKGSEPLSILLAFQPPRPAMCFISLKSHNDTLSSWYFKHHFAGAGMEAPRCL